MNKDNYQYTKDFVYIKIHKPLYGTFIYIRDSHLNYARKHNIPLKIEIPQGTFIRTVADWMENSQRIEKVFLQPNNPMVLYGNHVVHAQKEEKQDER